MHTYLIQNIKEQTLIAETHQTENSKREKKKKNP